MNVNPKQGIIKGYANISENKTIALDYKENNVVSKWYPWAPVPEKTLYAWKNASDQCIYSVDEEVETTSILIYVPAATGLTETTGTFEDDKIGYDGSYYERYTEGDVDVSSQ